MFEWQGETLTVRSCRCYPSSRLPTPISEMISNAIGWRVISERNLPLSNWAQWDLRRSQVPPVYENLKGEFYWRVRDIYRVLVPCRPRCLACNRKCGFTTTIPKETPYFKVRFSGLGRGPYLDPVPSRLHPECRQQCVKHNRLMVEQMELIQAQWRDEGRKLAMTRKLFKALKRHKPDDLAALLSLREEFDRLATSLV